MGLAYPAISIGTNQIRSAGSLPAGRFACSGLVVEEIGGRMTARIAISGVTTTIHAVSTATLSCFVAAGDIAPLPPSYSDGDYWTPPADRRLHYYSTQELLQGGPVTRIPLFSTIEYGNSFADDWNYTITNIVISWSITIYPYPYA